VVFYSNGNKPFDLTIQSKLELTHMDKQAVATISYFSDVLCVWAYVAQIQLDEVRRTLRTLCSNKKSLTGDTTERVDTRVLQVIFSFERGELPIFVGQQMDVFINALACTRDKPAIRN
jgi:hypothetical protein